MGAIGSDLLSYEFQSDPFLILSIFYGIVCVLTYGKVSTYFYFRRLRRRGRFSKYSTRGRRGWGEIQGERVPVCMCLPVLPFISPLMPTPDPASLDHYLLAHRSTPFYLVPPPICHYFLACSYHTILTPTTVTFFVQLSTMI